jgi:hypothetical protein
MARGRSDGEEAVAKPRNDAYTGMLVLSLIGLLLGSVLLFLDFNQHSGSPQQVQRVQPFNPNPPDEPAQKK